VWWRGKSGCLIASEGGKSVTGQRSNQLNYVPTCQINEMRNDHCLCGFARFAYRAPVAPNCPKERDSCPNRPQTASKFLHFRALLRLPKQPAQRAPGNPEFCQSGQNHQQNFRKSLSQKYPNSFSQNTKDHLRSPRVGLNEILKFGHELAAFSYFGCQDCASRTSRTTLSSPMLVFIEDMNSRAGGRCSGLFWKEAMKYDSYH
jgi:hypothetical protein